MQELIMYFTMILSWRQID